MLGCTVDELGERMSATEFARWQVYCDEEQIGPEWDRIRHGQLLAALHNGPCVPPRGAKAWRALDFLPPGTWAAPAPPPKPQSFADIQAAARRAGMMRGTKK